MYKSTSNQNKRLGKSNLKNWQLECDPFISGWPLLSGILFLWVLECSEFQGLEMVGEILQNFKMEAEKRLETYGSCKKVTVPVWKFSINLFNFRLLAFNFGDVSL